MFKASLALFAVAIISATIVGPKRSETAAWLVGVTLPVLAAVLLLLASFGLLLWEVMP
jgi:hypothetical protein